MTFRIFFRETILDRNNTGIFYRNRLQSAIDEFCITFRNPSVLHNKILLSLKFPLFGKILAFVLHSRVEGFNHNMYSTVTCKPNNTYIITATYYISQINLQSKKI
jgi:hypothetical protein